MSVVIVGGNECMVRRYKDICKEYKCRAKVFPKTSRSLKQIGSPDLLILFTNTVSHKMVCSAIDSTKGKEIKIERCHSSSGAALKSILENHGAVGNADA